MSCVEANVLADAVQGCTDSWTNAPFAVPSIAGDGEEGPKGRAHDARASAAVHGRTVSRPRRRREAQGSSIRRMRIEPPRPALDLFGYFLGQCQKVTRSPVGRVKALLTKNREGKARNWTMRGSCRAPFGPFAARMFAPASCLRSPACAGMTRRKGRRGFARREEMKSRTIPVRLRAPRGARSARQQDQ